MRSRPAVALGLGVLAFIVGIMIILYALTLGFHVLGGTVDQPARSAKGQAIAVPAVMGASAGLVAALARTRAWAFVLGCAAAALAVAAVWMSILLPET